jgi:geranylgeranyl transferase type-2 subunit beta
MYLEDLTLRLARGLGQTGEAWRMRHAGYLLAQQRGDGGFAGREGESDLYYTSFAVRSLALLGVLEGDVAARAAAFLRGRLSGEVPVVDFLSLIYSATTLRFAAALDVFEGQPASWRGGVAAALEQLRRPDGGYAKTAEGQAGSMYQSFLVVLCQQLIEQPTPNVAGLVEFVRQRWRPDGGFLEMNVMKRSGTNPTAAAVALLTIFDCVDDAVRDSTVEFLLDMQTGDEGGLRANTRIPIADLLSTFTGLLTLSDLGSLGEADLRAARRFVDSLQLPDGGFHGASWDPGHDVEYTFYGLGATALLADSTEVSASHG